jgi:hypothetical protein
MSAGKDALLKINLPPEEALRRALRVKPPKDWKKTIAAQTKKVRK